MIDIAVTAVGSVLLVAGMVYLPLRASGLVGPCSHDWTDWQEVDYKAMQATEHGTPKVGIVTGERRECRKCGEWDSRVR